MILRVYTVAQIGASMDKVGDVVNSRQSNVDRTSNFIQSTIDPLTERLRLVLRDPTLGERFVRMAMDKLGEGKLYGIADYTTRKSTNPGRAFVKICKLEMSTYTQEQ